MSIKLQICALCKMIFFIGILLYFGIHDLLYILFITFAENKDL